MDKICCDMELIQPWLLLQKTSALIEGFAAQTPVQGFSPHFVILNAASLLVEHFRGGVHR